MTRRLSLLSFVLSATLLAGLAAVLLLDVEPVSSPSGPGVTAYVPAPTPAIDALGDKLAQKPDIWTAVADAQPLFGLRTIELLDLPARYDVREHGLGGREDTLSFGDFGSEALHLQLIIYRTGGEAPAPSTFFVDLARRAAESGVGVVSLGRAVAQETKFGVAEVAEAQLSRAGAERSCRAFRLAASADMPHRIMGWACDAEPVTAPEIGCFVDHLALTEAAQDTPLAALFEAAAGRQRPECGGVPLPVPPKGA